MQNSQNKIGNNLSRLLSDIHRQKIFLSIYAIAIFSIIFTLKDPSTYPWFKAFASMLCLWFLFTKNNSYLTFWFWLVLLGYHTPLLIKNVYYAANHYFVLVYLVVAILVYLIYQKKDELLTFHMRCILAIVLFLGGLHKLLEPSFVNGSFFMYQINMGVFLKPFASLFSDWSEATVENLKTHKEIQNLIPSENIQHTLKAPVNDLKKISLIFTWGAILMELSAGILIGLFPKKNISHFFLILTILSVFIFRLETGFLSLLAAMGLILSPSKNYSIFYLFLFMLFTAFVVSTIGLK